VKNISFPWKNQGVSFSPMLNNPEVDCLSGEQNKSTLKKNVFYQAKVVCICKPSLSPFSLFYQPMYESESLCLNFKEQRSFPFGSWVSAIQELKKALL